MSTRSTVRRVPAVLAALSCLALACSSDSGDGDPTPAADVAADAVTAPDDAAAVPDAEPEVVEDLGGPTDVDWDTLPRLPQDTTFTTRFAAGAAERDITPSYDVFMGGFGFCAGSEDQCRKSEGVHDPLMVSVVAIADTETGEVVMLGGVDSSGMLHYDHKLLHAMIRDRLYEDFGVRFEGERLVLTASHAHSAPDITGLWGPMYGYGRDDEYAALVREQATDAAAEAFANLGDIEMVWARGSSPNSTDGSAPEVDDELIVVRGTRPDATPVFTLSRWNAHPTAYGSGNNGLSADWWGPLRKFMADEFGGVAVHLTGAVGGTYPERPSECGLAEEAFPEGWKDPDVSDSDRMKVTCTGKLVFDAAVEAMKDAQPVAETGVEFRFREFAFRPDNELLLMAAQAAPVPFEWVDIDDPESGMLTETGVYRVGNLHFIATPGESFPAFGNRAKQIVLDAGFTDPVALGLANDWLGYILLDEQWEDEELGYHQGLAVGKELTTAFMTALEEVVASLGE